MSNCSLIKVYSNARLHFSLVAVGKPKCNFCFFKEKPKLEVVWGQPDWHLHFSADSGEQIAFTAERSAYGLNVSTHL